MFHGLSRSRFVCDETYQRELRQIWSTHWIGVASIQDFPELTDQGTPWQTVEVGGHSLILAQSRSQEWNAFHNVCRHRGTRLLEPGQGHLKNHCITCPYHAWSYDAEGALIGAPNMGQVDGFDRSDFSLLPVACQVWSGIVFVNLAENPTPLLESLQPIVDRLSGWNLNSLSLVQTLHYRVQANWKLIFQNYSECYHCPTVHPDLNQQTPYKSASNDLLAGPILGGPMQLAGGFETVSSDGKKVADAFPALNDEQKRSVYYYTVFPNLFVSAHPDYVMLHRLLPVDRSTTMIDCHFLAEDGATVESLKRAWKMWDQVNRQDWRVCELTQAGVQSPAFRPGPYSDLESMLAAFDRHYLSVMDDGTG